VIEEMARLVEIPIVASGGVASLKDLEIFYQAGASAAVVGSALYEGSISFEEIKDWIKDIYFAYIVRI
jgi:phosphoribosylformimino-5-aminoimidazole carboxamide ribotide isomerase